MQCKKIKLYSVDKYTICNYTKTSHIVKLVALEKCNRKCYTRKINKDEYILLETGEVKEYNHTINRGQNIAGVRNTITRLRNLINNNFIGGVNELWITLTFNSNKIYNPKELYPIFHAFIKRLRYYLKTQLDYIYVPEPHEKGDWHIHLLLKTNKPLYIKNKELNKIWGHGFVKVNRLKDIDNIGAYVSAYLLNIKEGEQTKKGARLYLYPAGHQIYRCSKKIQKPSTEYITYEEAIKRLENYKLTYTDTIRIETKGGYKNTIHYEYYNKKRG